MNKTKRNDLIKKVLENCVIYPKAHPTEIEQEIIKINTISDNSISESKIIDKVSASLDVKQRIRNEKEWIKYSE